jgi:glutathione S-transferase
MILLYELVGADEKLPFSPHVWKVRMALEHKQLKYRTIPVRFVEIGGIEGGVSKTLPIIRDGDTVVADSFAIARYLENAYPDRPTLFGGDGGKAAARFIERWAFSQLHPHLGSAALAEIHDHLDESSKAYFRESREKRFGKTLEAAAAARDESRSAFISQLEPLRSMLEFQPFIGGQQPLFGDYIVFGALQWMRVVSTYAFVDDPAIKAWFERCLDLFDGMARAVPPAA